MSATEPRWKKELRGLFFLLVILSAIPGLLAAYFDIAYHKAGEDKPTIDKPIENIQHARKKYISGAEHNRIRLMWTLFLICFPSSILFGLVMRFGFGINIFKTEPLPQWVDKLMNDLKKEPQ